MVQHTTAVAIASAIIQAEETTQCACGEGESVFTVCDSPLGLIYVYDLCAVAPEVLAVSGLTEELEWVTMITSADSFKVVIRKGRHQAGEPEPPRKLGFQDRSAP